MSGRFEKWGPASADRGEIPDLFIDYGNPCGTLPKAEVILQHHDHWFSEIDDQWKQVPLEDLGKWGDEVYGPHVTLYGSYYRFSDALHPSLFEAEHGRPKPPELWHGSCYGPNRGDL